MEKSCETRLTESVLLVCLHQTVYGGDTDKGGAGGYDVQRSLAEILHFTEIMEHSCSKCVTFHSGLLLHYSCSSPSSLLMWTTGESKWCSQTRFRERRHETRPAASRLRQVLQLYA